MCKNVNARTVMWIYSMGFLLNVQSFLIFHYTMHTGNCHSCPSELDSMKKNNAGCIDDPQLQLRLLHFSSKGTINPLYSSLVKMGLLPLSVATEMQL